MARVRTRLYTIGLILTLISAGERASAQAPDRGTGPRMVPGPVRVIEGDTLEVFVDGTRVGVRVIGIKAPPGNTPCGREAIAATQALVSDGIYLDEDLLLPTIESRRKLRLYRVTTSNGRLLAEQLAEAGLAAEEPDDAPGRDNANIRAAEAAAKGAGRGCLSSGNSAQGR